MSILDKLPKKFTRAMGKAWLKTKKASPEICVIGGIVCGAGALVLVGVNTWKHKDNLQKSAKKARNWTETLIEVTEEEKKKLKKKDLKRIQTNEDGKEMLPVKVYVDQASMTESQKNALFAAKIDFAKDIVKAYWLPVTLEIGSVFLIWKGRTILRKNLSAMTAAYAAMAEAYRKYRQRVADRYGKDVDEELALGYSVEEHVDEDGNVEKVVKMKPDGNLNPYGFFLNEGYFNEAIGEWFWHNEAWARKSKLEKLQMIRQEQDTATWELRTIAYWRLENTMLRLGVDPKEAAKFHDIGKVWKEGADNVVEFCVLEGEDQLMVNKGFTDSYCSQADCYINPKGAEYIGYIDAELEKYDRRYGRHADGDAPYRSFNLEADKLIRRYNKEKAEQLIFNNMSDRAKRKMAKIPLRYD